MMLHCTTMRWLNFLCRRTISLQICQSVLSVTMQMSAWVHTMRQRVKYLKDGNTDITDLSCSIWTWTAHIASTSMKIMSSSNMTEKFQHSLELNTVCCKRWCWLWDGYWKVCCCWVPDLLTGRQKWAHICVPSELLGRHGTDSNDFVLNIMAGDESWFHSCDQKIKITNIEWHHKDYTGFSW